jgi:hypothetical protein
MVGLEFADGIALWLGLSVLTFHPVPTVLSEVSSLQDGIALWWGLMVLTYHPVPTVSLDLHDIPPIPFISIFMIYHPCSSASLDQPRKPIYTNQPV